MRQWQDYQDECTNCGESPVEVHTDAPKWEAYDGDMARCPNCKVTGWVSVDDGVGTVHWESGEVPYPDYKHISTEAMRLLRALADVQNDAPLEKYREEWEEIMRETWEFLEENEENKKL